MKKILAASLLCAVSASALDWAQNNRTWNADLLPSGALSFPSGATGHFGCSIDTQFDCSYEACGSEGRLLVDHGAMCAWPGGEFKVKLWHGDQYEEIDIPSANHYILLVQDFQTSLLEGRPMEITLDDTLANMEAIDTVLSAAK